MITEADFWTRSVNRHLSAWTGKTMESFPAFDFVKAESEGSFPFDAAQDAIDVQASVDDKMLG